MLSLLHEAVQEFRVLPIADVLANHFLVQSGVFSEPLGHLVVVYGAAKETFFLQELDAFLGLLVKLLRACDQQLDTQQETLLKHISFFKLLTLNEFHVPFSLF